MPRAQAASAPAVGKVPGDVLAHMGSSCAHGERVSSCREQGLSPLSKGHGTVSSEQGESPNLGNRKRENLPQNLVPDGASALAREGLGHLDTSVQQGIPCQGFAPTSGPISSAVTITSPCPGPGPCTAFICVHSKAGTKAHRILPCLCKAGDWSRVCLISWTQSPRIEGMVIKKPREQCLTLSKCFLVVIQRSKENPEENTW